MNKALVSVVLMFILVGCSDERAKTDATGGNKAASAPASDDAFNKVYSQVKRHREKTKNGSGSSDRDNQ